MILILWCFFFLVFLVFQYRPVIEELADIILSADVETVEAIQRRYGEQVEIFCFISIDFWLRYVFLDFLQFTTNNIGYLFGETGNGSTESDYRYDC